MATRDARRELAELDLVFACLAHASRRQILLSLLHHDGAMTAGEIARRFGCSWPTTSRHLKQLEQAELVSAERRGRERVYALASERITRVAGGWVRRFEA
ncbi:MAG TPA: metalloregulator ArsR/SmtB family transcription factor [Myxococcota bacterium]|nr:metalloregulator ArsR/SmtB family transcription factor [Myxococcota bacterium]